MKDFMGESGVLSVYYSKANVRAICHAVLCSTSILSAGFAIPAMAQNTLAGQEQESLAPTRSAMAQDLQLGSLAPTPPSTMPDPQEVASRHITSDSINTSPSVENVYEDNSALKQALSSREIAENAELGEIVPSAKGASPWSSPSIAKSKQVSDPSQGASADGLGERAAVHAPDAKNAGEISPLGVIGDDGEDRYFPVGMVKKDLLDSNNVDRATGRHVWSDQDISIGTNDGTGLIGSVQYAVGEDSASRPQVDVPSLYFRYKTYVNTALVIRPRYGSHKNDFRQQYQGGPWVPDEADGATFTAEPITINGVATFDYVYTTRDGTRVIYRNMAYGSLIEWMGEYDYREKKSPIGLKNLAARLLNMSIIIMATDQQSHI